MDFINELMEWLQVNWGVTVFGATTIGGLITTATMLIKQWLGTKKLSKDFLNLFDTFNEKYKNLESLYEKTVEENKDKDLKYTVVENAVGVMFDGMAKLVLASKLDSDDKQAFIASIERHKLMNLEELKTEAKQVVSTATEAVEAIVDTSPEQNIVNIAKSASSLLDKYTTPKAE